MSRLGRVGRRPDHWDSPHERARLRVAERMAGDLGAEEAGWLDEHLAGCAPCAALAAQYAADRLALRALRDAAPEPPRDLWARTAAAIEQEASGSRADPLRVGRRVSRIPLGAWSGIAVIALVVGASAISGLRPQSGPAIDSEPSSGSTTGGDGGSGPDVALATPFAVGAGDVQWVDKSANGGLGYNNANVDEVCPAAGTSGCPALEDAQRQDLALQSAPRTIIRSPTDGQAVVVADNGSGGDQIIVFDLPQATPTPATAPSTTPTPTASAVDTRSASALASLPGSAQPDLASPTPSAAPGSSAPASAVADPSAPTQSPGLTPVAPTLSPTPSLATTIAIANDIQLVGESAAFSADGAWFAFTARPDDGSTGPDVYLWHVGDGSVRKLTTDGSTVFASWDGDQVVASRPDAATAAGTDAAPISVRIDPATGAESPAGGVWRPIIDPTRRRAIGWSGTIAKSADGKTWTPDVGRLELGTWTAAGTQVRGSGQGRDSSVVTESATGGFDVRWDEAGDWVAIWIADSADPSVGRLSLYRIDTGRDRLEQPKDAPNGVPALPGFSIGDGRLAWATPPGQDGEGSRIQIVAWNDDGVGSIESAPGEDLVLIR
ncbi:MAG: hypothetical protein QOI52_240 [Chloroflexota bacterium]|nr:hypothetical protein [Chloroflexota bacterium]